MPNQAGELQAFDSKGEAREGWPVTLALPKSKLQLSYASLVQDQASCFVLTAPNGATDVINTEGQRITGFPVSAKSSAISRFEFAPVIFDLNQDGQNAIVIASDDGVLSAYNYQAELLPGFPIRLEQKIGPLAAGYFTKTRAPGLVALSQDTLFLIQESDSGSFEVSLAQQLEEEEEISSRRSLLIGPVIADLDQNGQDEILFVSKSGRVKHFDPSTKAFSVRSLHARSDFGAGSTLSPEGQPVFGVSGHSSLADLDLDGRIELIHPASSQAFENFDFEGPLTSNEFSISAWDAKNGMVPRGFPIRVDAQQNQTAQIIDLDRDRRPEVIFSDGRLRLQAKSIAGVSPKAWPKRLDGSLVGPISIGDIDSNGLRDILATTSQGTLFVWRSLMRTDVLLDWPYPRHDLQATGNFNTGRSLQLDGESTDNCTCQSVDSTPSQVINLGWLEALLLIGFAYWLRRREQRLRIRN